MQTPFTFKCICDIHPLKSNGVWCALFELWKQLFLLLNDFDDRLLRLHNQVVCLMAYLTGQQGALTPLSHLIPPLMLVCFCVSHNSIFCSIYKINHFPLSLLIHWWMFHVCILSLYQNKTSIQLWNCLILIKFYKQAY